MLFDNKKTKPQELFKKYKQSVKEKFYFKTPCDLFRVFKILHHLKHNFEICRETLTSCHNAMFKSFVIISHVGAIVFI